MKKLNLRLLAILVCATGAIVLVVYLVHEFQTRRHADFFLRQAAVAEDNKDLAKAIGYFNRYLEFRPDDVDVRARLALTLADLAEGRWQTVKDGSQYGAAYSELEKVLRADPTRKDVRRRLIQVSIAMGRYRDAKEDHLERYFEEELKRAEDAELLEFLGQCQAGLDAPGEAANSFAKAIARAPDRIDAYVWLTALLQQNPEILQQTPDFPPAPPEKAKDANYWMDYWMEEMVRSNPKSAHAFWERSKYRYNKLAFGESLEDAQEALRLGLDSVDVRLVDVRLVDVRLVDVRLLAAVCCLGQRQFDQARQHALDGLKLDPKERRIYLVLADIEMASGHADRAISWLREGISTIENPDELTVSLARLLIGQGKLDEAGKLVDQLEKRKFRPPVVDFLRARLDCAQGRWPAANELLTKARPGLIGISRLLQEADYWQGRCYQQLGNPESAMAAFRRALATDARYADPRLEAEARLALAECLMRANRIGEAMQEYRQVLDRTEWPAGGALELARWAIVRNLQRPEAERNWGEVQALIDRAAEKAPDAPGIPLLRAEVLVAQGQLDEAEKLLLETRAKKPQEAAVWVALANLAMRQRKPEQARKLLDEAQASVGDSAALRLVRAYLLLQSAGPDKKKGLAALVDPAKQFSEQETLQLWRGMIPLVKEIGDFALARELCRKVSEKDPSNLEIRLEALGLALRDSDEKAASDLLGAIRQIEGEGPYWHYAGALSLVGDASKEPRSGADQAMEHLDQAEKLRPNWRRVSMLRAGIHELQGDKSNALTDYLRAIDLGERSLSCIQRAVQLLYGDKQISKANELLQKFAQEKVPFTEDLLRMQSRLWGEMQNFEAAEDLASRVAEESKDYRDELWLGYLLEARGRLAKQEGRQAEGNKFLADAEARLRSAVRMSSKSPETWVFLVQFLARTDQAQEAEEAIRDCRSAVPAKDLPRCLAECYLALGNLEEAGKQYQAALADSPDDLPLIRGAAEFCLRTGTPQLAESQLKRIVEGKLKADPNDVLWARRTLALGLAAKGGYPNLEQAIGLVNKNLAVDSSSLPDRRTKAVLLASHPLRNCRKEAIPLLEELVQQGQSPSPQERFLLAQLYEKEGDKGDWAKASGQFRLLNEPQYVAAYVRSLLQRNEINEAELRLNALEQTLPAWPELALLRAEIQFRRSQTDAALKTLTELRDKLQSQNPKPVVAILTMARVFEDFGQRLRTSNVAEAGRFLKEAEAIFRDGASQLPGGGLLLAAFLARQDRLDEALALAGRSWQESDPQLIASASGDLVSVRSASPGQLRQLEQILSAAAEKHNRPVAILMTLSELYGRQERFDELERAYREMAGKERDNPAILNNLAEVLALRRKDANEAHKMIERAVELAGPMASLLDTRASVYLALGQPQKAVDELQKVLADEPRPNRYFHLALACNAAGRKSDAKKSLSEAQRLGLTADQLHPLERPAFDSLVRALP